MSGIRVLIVLAWVLAVAGHVCPLPGLAHGAVETAKASASGHDDDATGMEAGLCEALAAPSPIAPRVADVVDGPAVSAPAPRVEGAAVKAGQLRYARPPRFLLHAALLI
jgi:hypothetical protein